MFANLETKTVERNVWQDSLRDGLMELSLGVYLLITGFLTLADATALFILLMVFAPALVKRLKEKFTYPRIGYVKFNDKERNTGRRILSAVVAAVLAIALVVFFSNEDERVQTLYKWLPLLPALLFAAVFIPMARKTGFVRYYVMSALALATGLILPFLNLAGKMDAIGLYMAVMGAIFAVWGAVIFADFLQSYPVHTGETE